MENFIQTINGLVWGIPMLTLLLGTGIFLTIGLRFLSVTKLPFAFGQLFKKPDQNDEGDVTPFGALMTALSSTIGTGNIAGVAAAITIGGPGAVFWMWMTAIVGTATKYSEGVLAVKYREIDADGRHVGWAACSPRWVFWQAGGPARQSRPIQLPMRCSPVTVSPH